MKLILRNRSSRAMPSATFELTGSTWYIPFGRSVSAKNSASRSEPIGVALAGFTTIGAPTASEGATLCATRFSGKLNGVIPRTGPIGKRRRMPTREPSACSVSRRISSSSPWRITSEAHRNVLTARVASTVAHFSGLPPSAAISFAFSSIVSPAASRCGRARPRGPIPGASWTPRTSRAAVATASSTSASVGTPISATTLSSNGLCTSNVPSPVRHSPFTR